MTITSPVKGDSNTRFNVVAIVASSLKHGTTTESTPSSMRGDSTVVDRPVDRWAELHENT